MNTTQEIAELIESLTKEKKITVKQMLSECGVNRNLVTSLKVGQMPSADKLAKIANYLEVSTDYLLGSAETPNKNKEKSITIKEKAIIEAYNSKPELQEAINKLLEIDDDEYVELPMAARTEGNIPSSGTQKISKKQLEKLRKMPGVQSDEDL